MVPDTIQTLDGAHTSYGVSAVERLGRFYLGERPFACLVCSMSVRNFLPKGPPANRSVLKGAH